MFEFKSIEHFLISKKNVKDFQKIVNQLTKNNQKLQKEFQKQKKRNSELKIKLAK